MGEMPEFMLPGYFTYRHSIAQCWCYTGIFNCLGNLETHDSCRLYKW